MTPPKKPTAAPVNSDQADPVNQPQQSASDKVQQLQADLRQAQERERRALADYQNLVKRTQEDRVRMMTFANRELLSSLLQPLEHLSLAAAQLSDQGLDMVVTQFWQVLSQAGLEEIKTDGQPFNPELMEVVEAGDKKQRVIKVVKKGYQLHGQVLQHAKVILD